MSEQSYTVFEPPEVQKNLVERADELIFIKDGFAFWAMIAPLVWMIYHRLWLPLIGFFVLLGALQALAHLFGASSDAGGLILLGLSVAFGIIANDIRRLMLERGQYKMIGAIAGYTRLECERRFFANWSPLLNNLQEEVLS